MSSGSELLRKLKQQKLKQKQKSCKLSQEDESTDDSSVGRAAPGRALSITTLKTTVEVCLGPDCSGAGGGAALLEIEDLVSRRTSPNRNGCNIKLANKVVDIVLGGCRDFCTVGPNVHVKNDSRGNDAHHIKVDGPDVCRSIVLSIYGEEETVETSSTMNLLRRRKDGIRWRSHKERAMNDRRLKVRERPTTTVGGSSQSKQNCAKK